jgi:hypothetical protein
MTMPTTTMAAMITPMTTVSETPLLLLLLLEPPVAMAVLGAKVVGAMLGYVGAPVGEG